MSRIAKRVSRVRQIGLATWLGIIVSWSTTMPSALAVQHEDTRATCLAPAAVCGKAVRGAATMIESGTPASILVDANDFPGVLRAARDLRSDLSAVAGKDATLSTDGAPVGPAIIVGTLGHSSRIDRIVAAKHIDTTSVAGRWEAYLITVVDTPEPGIARAVVVIGYDKRGTIFGIYELSRRLGVSPWAWWADVPIATRSAAYLAPGRFVDAPSVRYRGIFLNDEDPALGGWIKATYGASNHKFYARVFELILRLKGNYLWPAMWGRAFADDDAESPGLADEFGIVIGTTHHEPMMRAHVEWQRYGKGPWDYTKNAEALRDFWRKGIERMGGNESVVTLGMRGDGDEPMSQDTAIPLLERIVADQRKIIAEVTDKPAAQTPQVWALYKEVQDYYDAGMKVPDDVTLLFSDDNWGNLRRLPDPGATRAGGYGIYYHFDYVGGPRNYKWINTNQIERVWEQMQRAQASGADRLWIVNVGDLKPMEFPISFFLDQAWNPEAMTLARLHDYPATWAAEQFGSVHAKQIAELLTRYTQYNARRKPELLSADTWSLVNYHEAEHILADWDALVERTQRIGTELPAAYHDAWFELVDYPISASANLNHLYVATARNRMFGVQGRASANVWADEARRRFARDAELALNFEHDIAGGKWIHMMSQTHIGYTNWQQPERNILPALMTVDVPDQPSIGVAVEGDVRAWPETSARAVLPTLDPIAATSRELVVFNRGSQPFEFTTQTSQPWLHVTPSSGEAQTEDQTLQVTVDWDAVPVGADHAMLIVRGSGRVEVHIDVPVIKPDESARKAMRGFVESDGVIAIEAEHFSRAVAPSGQGWKVIPDLGRTLSAVIPWPLGSSPQTPGDDGAHLEYPITVFEAGDFDVRVVLSPNLDLHGSKGLRFAVSMDNGTPQIVTVTLDPTPGSAAFAAWEHAVIDNAYLANSQIHVDRAGAHTLKLWQVDANVAFQRIEIARVALRPSTLGPPESTRADLDHGK